MSLRLDWMASSTWPIVDLVSLAGRRHVIVGHDRFRNEDNHVRTACDRIFHVTLPGLKIVHGAANYHELGADVCSSCRPASEMRQMEFAL